MGQGKALKQQRFKIHVIVDSAHIPVKLINRVLFLSRDFVYKPWSQVTGEVRE